MLNTAIFSDELKTRKPVPELEEHQGDGTEGTRSSAAEIKRTRRGRSQTLKEKGQQGQAHEHWPLADPHPDHLDNEIIDELGPLSVEEKEKIRGWLKLGS